MSEGYESIPGYLDPPRFECLTCYGSGEIDNEDGDGFESCPDCDGTGYIGAEK